MRTNLPSTSIFLSEEEAKNENERKYLCSDNQTCCTNHSLSKKKKFIHSTFPFWIYGDKNTFKVFLNPERKLCSVFRAVYKFVAW